MALGVTGFEPVSDSLKRQCLCGFQKFVGNFVGNYFKIFEATIACCSCNVSFIA